MELINALKEYKTIELENPFFKPQNKRKTYKKQYLLYSIHDKAYN